MRWDTLWATHRNAENDEELKHPLNIWPAFIIIAAMLTLLALPEAGFWTMSLIGLGALLTIISPAFMIALVVITVPVQEAIMLPYFRGDLTLTQIAVFGLTIGWGLTFWRFRIWLDSITMWYMAVAAAFCISLVAMDEPGLWFGEVYRWGVAALFFIICRSVLREWVSIRVVLWGILAATLGTWAFSYGQLAAGNGPEHMFRGGTLRVSAMFGTPNPLAAYIEFALPIFIVLGLLGIQKSFRDRIGTYFWLTSCLTSLFGLIILSLTQSRGGMVGFAMASIVVLWVLPKYLRLATVLAGVVLVLVIGMTPAGQSQLSRFENVFKEPEPSQTGIADDYDLGRSTIWRSAIRMFDGNPWTGVGAGEFDYHYREYTPVWYQRFPFGQAHNGWLQMAAQAGITGILAFTGWVVASLLSLIGAARRSSDGLARALAIGALAVMIAFTVHSLVDYLNVLSLGLQLSAVAAIGLNLAPDPLKVVAAKRTPAHGSDCFAEPLHTGLA